MTFQSNLFIIRYVFDILNKLVADMLYVFRPESARTLSPQVAKPMMAKVHKVLDAMIGVHLNAHVMSERDLILCGTPAETQDRWIRIPHAKL